MKSLNSIIVLLLMLPLTVLGQQKTIDAEKSFVTWTGKKIGGSHTGEIQIQHGYFNFENGNIVGGQVIINMNTITNTDLKDPGYNQKLVGHLKSDDFFGVTEFPIAKFELSSATPFVNDKATLRGKLTIKGATREISFNVEKNRNKYLALLEIDRSLFNVRYGSDSFFENLGDKAIDDIFLLDISLKFL